LRAPRLKAGRFERLIIEQIRDHILTESNVRELAQRLDEEMDGVAREQQKRLETIEAERAQVRRKIDRLWHVVEFVLEITNELRRMTYLGLGLTWLQHWP